MLVLFLYIATNYRLVQSYCANTIAARPKTTPKKRTFSSKNYTMNSNSTFTLKVPYRHRYTILWRYAQQHMKVIGGSIAFQQHNFFLTAQFTNNLADRFAMFLKCFFSRYLGTITTWYLHSHFTWAWLCQSFITVLLALRSLPHGGLFIKNTLETAEPCQFSPAEPVDYWWFRKN